MQLDVYEVSFPPDAEQEGKRYLFSAVAVNDVSVALLVLTAKCMETHGSLLVFSFSMLDWH